MSASKYVIAGGGMVAGYAAKQMVDLGLKPGELAILSADTSIPYERPPLSKGFLAGRETEESIRINSETFYKDHGIEVRLGRRIAALDPGRKRLALEDGGEIGFEKLVIATGARPRKLSVPGAELGNVQYLRSLDDSIAIRRSASGAKRAVVIGGGFIAMESAAVLAQQGIEITMVLRENRIWQRFFSPDMSAFFERYYKARGVRFITAAQIRELRGDGSVKSAMLADGQTIACDLVVAGIGVEPTTELLEGSGIEVNDGVRVNEYLESSASGILAAGDVANYHDVLFGRRRRVEHWDNAVSQGQYCAHAILGDRTPFRHVPYFFSDVFDLSYEFWGDPLGADQIVHRGDLSSGSFSVWWLQQAIMIAAFVMNRPKEERAAAAGWIEKKRPVAAMRLADAGTPLADALEPAR